MIDLTFKKAKAVLSAAGETFTLDPAVGESDAPFSWELAETDDRFFLALHTEQEVVFDSVGVEFSFNFQPTDRLFLNGYQSWTDSREWPVNGKMRGINHLPRWLSDAFGLSQYGDYSFVEYGEEGQLHGFSYAYVRRENDFFLLGSLAEQSGYTLIRFDTKRGTISLQKDCHGHHVSGNYTVFDLGLWHGGEKDVFDHWFEALKTPRPRGGRLTGYTSWYNRYQKISQASIEEDLAGFAALSEKPDVFQIDDGYQTYVGDWLFVDHAKFPDGMGEAAKKIRAAGMTPGLWLAPFAAEKKSRLVKEHPDWLLRDEKGAPVKGGSNWSGFYGLDIYHEGLRAYLKNVFHTVLTEWGYGLVKLDFLYACCIVPRRNKTRAQVMADGMAFLREVCGDALILGCGVPLVSAFGLADFCRVGCDVSLSWRGDWYMRLLHRERPSTRNTVLNTVFRRQLNGRAFWNDPDVFLLRDENLNLKPEEKKMLATVNALCGSVLFTSDNVGRYAPAIKDFYDRTAALSPNNFRAAELTKKSVVVRYEQDGGEKTLSIPL